MIYVAHRMDETFTPMAAEIDKVITEVDKIIGHL
jgi:hypothetical protein